MKESPKNSFSSKSEKEILCERLKKKSVEGEEEEKKVNIELFLKKTEKDGENEINTNFIQLEKDLSLKRKKRKCQYYLTNIKEIIFIVLLVVINLVNYSILNIIYSFLGLLLMLFIFNTDSKSIIIKNVIVKIIFVNNILVLIFKIIFLGFYLADFANDFIDKNKKLLINLGLKYLEKNDIPKFLNTYIPELVIFIALILYTIYKNNDDDINFNMNKVVKRFKRKYYILIAIQLLLLPVLTTLNLNFLTLIYSTLFLIGLIMIIKDKHSEYFFSASFILVFLTDLHLIFVHVLNIYQFRQDYLKNHEYYYLKWFGIPKQETSFTYAVDVLLSVLLSFTCVISIKIRYRYLNVINVDPNLKNIDLKREKTISQFSLSSRSDKGCFVKFKKIFSQWITSPYFILHFCRIGIIIYLVVFKSLISELLFIWLFYSFLIIRINVLKSLTIFILWPVLIVNFYLYFVANIDNLLMIKIDNSHIYKMFSLEKLRNDLLWLYLIKYFIDFFIFTLFTILLLNFKEKDNKLKKNNSVNQLSIKNELRESLVDNRYVKEDSKSISVKIIIPAKEISLYELIIKFILNYIGVISIILLYLIAVNEVNVVHLILIIIFLIQLILPDSIKVLCFSIIIVIEMLILNNFVWGYLLGFIAVSPYFFGIMQILNSYCNFEGVDQKENYLWMILYCFYMQYQNFNSHLFKKYESKEYDWNRYINSKLINYPKCLYSTQKTIEVICKCYIWIILLFLFIVIIMFDTNLLFSIKLVIFLFILYKFLDLSQTNVSETFIIKYIWILIVYCGLNTMVVYFYQFFGQGLLIESLSVPLPEFVAKNLISIGIEIYSKNDLTKRFLPHYLSNFLSVLLLIEVKNIIVKLKKQNFFKLKLNEEIEKYENQIIQKLINENNSDNLKSNLQNDKKVDNLEFSKGKYVALKIVLFLLSIYWVVLFLVQGSLLINFQISFIMFLYSIIFGISFILLFRKFNKKIKKSSSVNKKSFYFTMFIRHEICEKSIHEKILRSNRKLTLKFLVSLTLISLWLTYSYGIIDMIKDDFYNNYRSLYDYMEAITYLVGVYRNYKNNIFSHIWGYFVLLVLLILERYFRILHKLTLLEILKMEKLAKIIEKKTEKEIKNNVSNEKIEINKQKSTQLKNEENIVENSQNDIKLIIREEPICNVKTRIDSKKNEQEEFKTNGPNIIRDKTIFLENFEKNCEILPNKLIRKFILIFYNYQKVGFVKKTLSTNLTITFQKSIKSFLEEFIVFMILLCAVIKLNFYSLTYIYIVILLQIKGRNINNIYITTIFLILLLVIQYTIFLLNLNNNSDPNNNTAILSIINKLFLIPIYDNLSIYVGSKWRYFCSLGTYNSQTSTLWIDFLTISTVFIYLYNFSFSIFEYSGYKNSEFHLIKEDKKFKESIFLMDDLEYFEIRESLREIIDIELPEIVKLRNDLRSVSVTSDKKLGIETSVNVTISKFYKKPVEKKMHFFEILFYLVKKNVYYSLHNFMLVLILILSLMNSGLISMVYIIFSLYYIYISRRFFLGRNWNLPRSLRKFLLPFIISDIFIQIIYQIPFNLFTQESQYTIWMKIIGINKIINYDDSSFLPNPGNLSLLVLKIITYFIISMQLIIFKSKQFKAFYVKMIFKQKESTYRSSMINSFLFNNSRILMMNRSMQNRNKINETLKELENQLEFWNKNLFNDEENYKKNKSVIFEEENKVKEKSIFEPADFLIKKEEKIDNLSLSFKDQAKEKFENYHSTDSDIQINKNDNVALSFKKILYSKFLVKIAVYLNQSTCSYRYLNKRDRFNMEVHIIKGETFIPSKIERAIDDYVESIDLKEQDLIEFESKLEKDQILNELNEEDSKNKIKDKFFNEKKKKDNDIKLFKKYLSNCYLIKYILIKLFYFFLENFHYVCYFFMILNNMLNSSIISLFWPIIVFGYGLLEYPKPRNSFWKIALFYSIFTIVLKFMFQLKFFNSFGDFKTSFNEIDLTYRIGIKIIDNSLSWEFFSYIIWDCIIILFITIQEYILITQGLWINSESEIESMKNAYDRIYLANSNMYKNYLDPKLFIYKENNIKIGSENTKTELNKEIPKPNNLKSYYDSLFPKIRNTKPGRDFYAAYFIISFILTIYLIFCYTNMDRNPNYKISADQPIREFSGSMVIVALIHIFFIVIDRVIYIKQTRDDIKLEIFYYNKFTGEKITEINFNSMNLSEQEAKQYEMTYFQNEEINYPLIAKYVLHFFMILFSHILIFFYFPIVGNKNILNNVYCKYPVNIDNMDAKIVDCNEFTFNGYLIFFYILYVLYLIFSAIQIKFGLLDMRKKSLLKRGDNSLYSLSFRCSQAIPFLYELKLFLDWTFTPTSMDLFKWLKFESVYDLLFITHCVMKIEKTRKIGEIVEKWEKTLFGCFGFLIVLLILIIPLILFSSLNPTNKINNVLNANIELSICFKKDGVSNNYSLYRNEYVSNIIPMNMEIWNTFKYLNSTVTKGFLGDLSLIQIIQMYNTSDSMWSLSFPHIEIIKTRIANFNQSYYDIFLNLKYSFSRPLPVGAQNSIKTLDYPLFITYNSTFYDNTKAKAAKINLTSVLDYFNKSLTTCNQKINITLPDFYIPSIHLTAESHPKVLFDPNFYRTVTLNFDCTYNNLTKPMIDYTKSYYNLSFFDPASLSTQGLVFHTFSDKVSQTNTNYDVVTFYITFIFVAGRLIRGALSGEAERIVFTEMPEPMKILNLCEGIKISRYRCLFEREEHLYYVMIDLMRSPEMLKIITLSSIRVLMGKKERESKRRKTNNKTLEIDNKIIEEINNNNEQKLDNLKESRSNKLDEKL